MDVTVGVFEVFAAVASTPVSSGLVVLNPVTFSTERQPLLQVPVVFSETVPELKPVVFAQPTKVAMVALVGLIWIVNVSPAVSESVIVSLEPDVRIFPPATIRLPPAIVDAAIVADEPLEAHAELTCVIDGDAKAGAETASRAQATRHASNLFMSGALITLGIARDGGRARAGREGEGSGSSSRQGR